MKSIVNRCRILVDLVALPSTDRTRQAVEAAYWRDDAPAAVAAMRDGRVKFGSLGYMVDALEMGSAPAEQQAEQEIAA